MNNYINYKNINNKIIIIIYRVRKLMETRLNHDSDRVETLERQLREARELAAESDRKFEEVNFFSFFFKEE